MVPKTDVTADDTILDTDLNASVHREFKSRDAIHGKKRKVCYFMKLYKNTPRVTFYSQKFQTILSRNSFFVVQSYLFPEQSVFLSLFCMFGLLTDDVALKIKSLFLK